MLPHVIDICMAEVSRNLCLFLKGPSADGNVGSVMVCCPLLFIEHSFFWSMGSWSSGQSRYKNRLSCWFSCWFPYFNMFAVDQKRKWFTSAVAEMWHFCPSYGKVQLGTLHLRGCSDWYDWQENRKEHNYMTHRKLLQQPYYLCGMLSESVVYLLLDPIQSFRVDLNGTWEPGRLTPAMY